LPISGFAVRRLGISASRMSFTAMVASLGFERTALT